MKSKEERKITMEYLQTPLNKYTFSNLIIKFKMTIVNFKLIELKK